MTSWKNNNTLESRRLVEEVLNPAVEPKKPGKIVARNKEHLRGLVEARIKELESMIEHAVVIENVNTDLVSIGTKVTIEYVEDDDTEEYSIVGVKEADPFNNKISNESPIARAILGRKIGDIVSVDSPNGKYDVKIVAITA